MILTLLVCCLAVIMVLTAVILLGVRVLFVKNGKFPSSHVRDIDALRRKGIRCAAHNGSDSKTNTK